MSESVLPMFSSRSFIVSGLTRRMLFISRFSFGRLYLLNILCMYSFSSLLILRIKGRYLKEVNDKGMKMTGSIILLDSF